MPTKIKITEVIQFIGTHDLNAAEKAVANKLSNEYYDKIKRSLNNITSLVVQVKKLGKICCPDKDRIPKLNCGKCRPCKKVCCC